MLNYLTSYPPHPMLFSDIGRLMHEVDFYQHATLFYGKSLSIDGLGSSNMANMYVEYENWERAIRLYQVSIVLRLPTLGQQTCHNWDVIDDFNNFKSVYTIENVAVGTDIILSSDVFVGGNSGYVFSKRFCQVYLGNQRYMSKFRYKKLYISANSNKAYRVNCNITASLLQGWSSNYYHFLIEITPKLLILEQLYIKKSKSFSQMCLLMPSFKNNALLNEVLIQSGIASNPNITILSHVFKRGYEEKIYNVTRLLSISWMHNRDGEKNSFWFPDKRYETKKGKATVYPSSLFTPSQYALSMTRHSLIRKQLFRIEDRIVLYASRDGSKRNQVIGEMHLINIMNGRYNKMFKVFRAYNLTLSEQINLFYSALVVLGAHGAALSNIIFCRMDVLVVEFPLSPHSEGLYFKILSGLIGIKYIALNMISMRYLDDLLLYPNAISLAVRVVDRWLYNLIPTKRTTNSH
eukprot:g1483.t1